MNSPRQSYALFVAFGVLLTAAVFMGRPATAQRAKRGDEPTIKMPFPMPQARDVAAESLFQVRVYPKLELDKDEATRFEVVAKQLSKFTEVPADRLRFFSAYEVTLRSKVVGWAGHIMEINAAPGGLFADVRVAPRFTDRFIYPATVKKYFERFFISPEGAVTHVESSAPDGGVGEPPVGAVTL